MDKVLWAVLVEEVKDIFKVERVEIIGVGLEVAVVYVQETVELEAVEVTLEEMVELMNSFLVEEGVDLLTVGQISRMNVVLIGMDMVEWSLRFFSDMPLAALSLRKEANSVLKADCCQSLNSGIE